MRIFFSSVMLAVVSMSNQAASVAVPLGGNGGEMASPELAEPQSGGDQFLDGIGETALVARYPLSGAARDWSRNTHHAALKGTGGTFVEDSRFGKVLALPGDGGAFLELPGATLQGVDAFSFSGWIFLEGAGDAPILDLGSTTGQGLTLTADGVRITVAGKTAQTLAPMPRGRWTHVVIVLDPATRTLTQYVDGAVAGAPAEAPWDLTKLIHPKTASANQVCVGGLRGNVGVTLRARLHDLRFYRVALSAQQVGGIHQSAFPGGTSTSGSDRGRPPVHTRPTVPVTSGSLTRLERVSEVRVDTTVGNLPRLPYTVAAGYRGGQTGPAVRVIWPSPTDNQAVAKPGTYELLGKVPGTAIQAKAVVTVKPARRDAPPRQALEAFPLDRVVLGMDLDGKSTPFTQNRDKFVKALAQTNPDAFLYMFRDAFGQKQPAGAVPLTVWDSQTTKLRGHATGHYLSAIAQAYASTGYDKALQATFLKKMDVLIDTLYDLAQKSGAPREAGGAFNADPTQVPPGPGRKGFDSNLTEEGIRTDTWNWGKGFISAYPPDQFIMLEQGATYGGQDNQIWAPYYTLHKLLAGLLDCYEVGGNRKALTVAQDMGLWVHARLKALPTETRIRMWNQYIAGEYGGMNEVLARLFRLTKEPRFLEGARLFDNIRFFYGNAQHDHGIEKYVDTFRGTHANQHIPQILGALETYRATGEAPYWRIADNFWDMAIHQYSYSIGGVAGAANPNNAECFPAQPNTLWENGLADGGQNETCATYNLLKLDRQLFLFQPDARFMDHYERGMYNHILASVAEHDPGNTYHVPLNPGARKEFGNELMDGFTCCNGTALESHTKLQDTIYFRSQDNQALFVNLFVPSTLTWKERNVVVTQQTSFPYRDTTRLNIQGSGTFALKVRVPSWATKGFFVTLNGKPQKVQAVPGTYATVKRTWKHGDAVELRMPFAFHLEPVMDQPNIASLCYGPVVLAAQEPEARTDWRKVTLDAADLGKTIQGDPKTLRFTLDGVAFRPFYETYDRHSVYLDVTLK